MKKLLTLIAFAAVLGLTAQNIPPQAINFQGVAIDKNGIPVPGMDELGNPIQNSAIRVRFSILIGSVTGTVSYQEEHLTTTDEFGRFNLEIGRGTAINGTFASINWGGDKHFLQVEVDLSALGTNYTLASVQEFLSVPYALYSKSSGSSSDDLDKDDQNEIQTLTLSGDLLSISQGNTVTLPADLDGQQLSISGGVISISNGNSISLPVDSDNQILTVSGNDLSISNGNTVALPISPDNQSLSISGNSLSISNGNSVTLPPNTDNQTLAISGNSVSISNGNSITLPTAPDNQTLALSGSTLSITNGNSVVLPTDADNQSLSIASSGSSRTLGISGGNSVSFTVNDADSSSSNELQTLSINGNIISLSSNGGSITLPQDQVNDADADSTNELQTISISNDTIFLSKGGFVKLPSTLIPSSNSSNSITSSQLDDLFGLQYTGNGSLGDFHSATSTLPTMKFLNYDDFFLMPGDTLNLVAETGVIDPVTTVLFVQDTCYLAGFINGKGTGQGYRNLNFNSTSSIYQTYDGLQAASGTNNGSSNYTGQPVFFREGHHSVNWNEWALLNYLDPYQQLASNLLNDKSFKVCASQYGEISGQDGGSGGQAYGAYGGRGGRGLIIIAKTLIINNAIFDLRGGSGTASPNTSYRGGAGGGGSLFISYEYGSIVNPIVNTTGGTAIATPTTIPLTNGANGRFLFHQR